MSAYRPPVRDAETEKIFTAAWQVLERVVEDRLREKLDPGAPVDDQLAGRKAGTRLAKLLRDNDVPAAQKYWRRHLESVAKYMVGNSTATLVDVLS
ncbi:hypothetical protein [Nocardia sp. NPDC005366]|uniref:hypothetical protein n=1 Tax=Nocardia sp. NPDC005366 TaxID=3156878 RepID=UPI0033A350E8